MTTEPVSPLPIQANVADSLNAHCFCRTFNPVRLQAQLTEDAAAHGLDPQWFEDRPHLFSDTVVFASETVVLAMTRCVRVIESIAQNPAYQAQALARAPAIARYDFGPQSACMGYDFHLTPQGPQLIEINTNAGGGLLNLALLRAQEVCCGEIAPALQTAPDPEQVHRAIEAMFRQEWRLQRADQSLQRVVITDDAPAQQYLAPEFALYRQLFSGMGLQAEVADPRDLVWDGKHLRHQGEVVDLVYNRLTDFYLQEQAHSALRQAYEAGAVVLTPHPRAHALLADKRNLITLSDPQALQELGVTAADQAFLAGHIPATQSVLPARADTLWAQRRGLFFKPVAGYGAKATYRGDKLTRRVWSEILQADFVAQALVPPGERTIEHQGVLTDLKFDLRAYTYAGRIQLFAARMYTGQTTNFRTQGGGFAPVVVAPAAK
jgi:hypothetical protein